MIAFAAIKMVLGGIFGPIFSVLGKLLSDWRIILIISIGLIAGFTYYSFKQINKKYELKQEQYEAEVKNSEVLRKNVSGLTQINADNQNLIVQMQKDKQIALEAVTTLSENINKNNKLLVDVQIKVNKIKAPPTLLTPYLAEAIDGVQQQRTAP